MRKGTDGTFGTPKPLAGQAGYKISETEVLKKEASEMENRLLLLQDRMKQQADADATTKSGSGTMWKSARTEKGTIRAYHKDVQEKHKKRSEEAGGGDPALRRRASKPSAVETIFSSKEALNWTISEVGEWLVAIQLSQYVDAFSQNEINGSILLDLTLEDLDYMNITTLGHRKMILKGVETLRRNKKFDPSASVIITPRDGGSCSSYNSKAGAYAEPPPIPPPQRSSSSSQGNTNIVNNTKSASTLQDNGKVITTTHWSQLEPLSSNKVTGKGGMLINPADDSGDQKDFLDEAAEQAAFKAAVEEWRRADAAAAAQGTGEKRQVTIVREYLPKGSNNASIGKSNSNNSSSITNGVVSSGDMWNNPFAANNTITNNNNAKNSNYNTNNHRHTVGGLNEGMLDEAAERAAFQAAVAQWRHGNSNSSSSNNSNTTASKSNSSSSTTSSTTATATTMIRKGGRASGINDSDEEDQGTGQRNDRIKISTNNDKNTVKLYEGMLDEEKEHAEFVRAVEAWRHKGSNQSRPNTGNSSSHSSSSSNRQGKGVTLAALSAAEKLSKELEQERVLSTQRLQKQREDAEGRLREANDKLVQLRQAGNQPNNQMNNNNYESDDEVPDTCNYSSHYSHSRPTTSSTATMNSAPTMNRVVVAEVKSSSSSGDASDSKYTNYGTTGPITTTISTARVALVESILGGYGSHNNNGNNNNYNGNKNIRIQNIHNNNTKNNSSYREGHSSKSYLDDKQQQQQDEVIEEEGYLVIEADSDDEDDNNA